MQVTSIGLIREQKRGLIDRFAKPDNAIAVFQILTTLAPLALLWFAVAWSAEISYWLTAAATLAMTLILVRVFVLMHDCGHGSLFRTGRLNKIAGFFLGVLAGMPQYVWSQHHAFHHSTNGNWDKYSGPFAIVTVDDYAAMSERQRRSYRYLRNLAVLPIGGFFYLLFNPRANWLKGTLRLLWHKLSGKTGEFKTVYWASPLEYWHQTWTNIVLAGLWVVMAWLVGPLLFFTVYVISTSLAAAIGIAVFTVQHNFEHSYASGGEGWDYDTAAVEGTSFLLLPRWLNWVTADIAYHHLHHISASIPNYRLASCHAEYQHLFGAVRRVKLSEIPASLKYILWDRRARRIISVAEFHVQAALAATSA